MLALRAGGVGDLSLITHFLGPRKPTHRDGSPNGIPLSTPIAFTYSYARMPAAENR